MTESAGACNDSDSAWGRRAAWLLLVALVLRVIMAFLVTSHVDGQGRQFLIEGDAGGYWELAEKMAAGDEYAIHTPPRRILRTPGFPSLLALVIAVCGPKLLAARLVLAVIGTLCCAATFSLGRSLASARVGCFALAYVALHPLHDGTSVLVLSELSLIHI